MKKQFTAVFLLAALTVTILAGCQSANADTPATKNTPVAPISHIQAPVENEKKSVSATWISAPHAENIALSHAGVTPDEARMERTELDKDDRIAHYEVEFHAGDYDYDYEINAATGEILKWDREYDPDRTPAVPTAPSETQPPQVADVTLLTSQEAETLALAHAELTAEEVHFQRSELDYDDTVLHYDVEFHAGHYEYDFEIDAVTGKILHWEREYDPEKVPVDPPVPTENPPEALITAQEAEEIALNHAGLARQEVMFDRTELDRDRNKTEYEVEFRVGRWEYSYEIDAVTGQILDYDKDYDE